METSFEYCAGLVREGDEDRFASANFAAADLRPSLLALYAFNLEVSKTRDSVSEPMLGEIRLQWWREAIAEIYETEPRKHLVVEALKLAVQRCDLPRAPFDTLIDARTNDLESEPFDTMASLDAYVSQTSTELMSQAWAILDPEKKTAVPEMLRHHAGQAWALTGLIRSLPYRAAQGQCIIPNDLIVKHQVDVSALFAGQMHLALRQCLDELLEMSDAAYRSCRDAAREVPSSLWPAFLHVGLVPKYLQDCRRDDFFEVATSIPLWRRQWRLLRCMTFGRL